MKDMLLKAGKLPTRGRGRDEARTNRITRRQFISSGHRVSSIRTACDPARYDVGQGPYGTPARCRSSRGTERRDHLEHDRRWADETHSDRNERLDLYVLC